jgi:hypothetical protein
MSRTRFALRFPYERRNWRDHEGAETMKYILMMNAPKAGFDTYRAWSEKDVQAHFAVLRAIGKDLTESGEFVATEGLAWPDDAKIVRAREDGTPITDGVFPESKEFLAGYWIVDVESPERAYEIAARISAAPGPGGVRTDMPIEVRQIMTAKPPELP